MAADHDILIQEYQKYKDELQEYEKQKYLYETRISDYGVSISEAISELRKLGVKFDTLNNLPDGELDLTNAGTVRMLLDEVHALYKDTIKSGMDILNSRRK